MIKMSKNILLSIIAVIMLIAATPITYAAPECCYGSDESDTDYVVSVTVGGTVWNDPRYSPSMIGNQTFNANFAGGVVWSNPRYAPSLQYGDSNLTLITRNWTVWHDPRYAPDMDEDAFLIRPRGYDFEYGLKTKDWHSRSKKTYYHYRKHYKKEVLIEFKPWRTFGVKPGPVEYIKID